MTGVSPLDHDDITNTFNLIIKVIRAIAFICFVDYIRSYLSS